MQRVNDVARAKASTSAPITQVMKSYTLLAFGTYHVHYVPPHLCTAVTMDTASPSSWSSYATVELGIKGLFRQWLEVVRSI